MIHNFQPNASGNGGDHSLYSESYLEEQSYQFMLKLKSEMSANPDLYK
jgi:hypothetical protein